MPTKRAPSTPSHLDNLSQDLEAGTSDSSLVLGIHSPHHGTPHRPHRGSLPLPRFSLGAARRFPVSTAGLTTISSKCELLHNRIVKVLFPNPGSTPEGPLPRRGERRHPELHFGGGRPGTGVLHSNRNTGMKVRTERREAQSFPGAPLTHIHHRPYS